VAEAALCMAELAAVANAEPTPFARDAIVTAHEADRLVAVVSNNSEEAIGAYLATHQLTEHIDQVIGRDHADPSRMKPHPEPVIRALRLFDATPTTAVMIGDSVSDILSAQAAGTRSIGYASKPTKVDGFSESGADAIVHSMAEIVHALAASVPSS
jgi:phosphoglycolate phosphatase-like HAD superfamily hydrolase